MGHLVLLVILTSRCESKGNAIRGDIYKINAFAGDKTKLTRDNADEYAPSWGSRP